MRARAAGAAGVMPGATQPMSRPDQACMPAVCKAVPASKAGAAVVFMAAVEAAGMATATNRSD